MQAHCVDEKQDLWVVYDTQTRYAAVVNGRELADMQWTSALIPSR
jgi:hypothetical protein